jgi:drug/metabolite transporter (DMT)-like permease
MLKIKKNRWLIIGIAAAVLAAPNATVIKYTVDGANPYFLNTVRFLAIALITTPFLVVKLRQFDRQNLKESIKAGLYMSVAVTVYVLAIKLSHASYVVVITLITPIFFVIFSARLTKEKITPRAIAGIILAAIGAMTIVILPIAIKQNELFIFYPWATVLGLMNCVTFPLAMISFKKANEGGVPMIPLLSISSWLVAFTSIAMLIIVGGHRPYYTGNHFLFGVIYSGLVVALVSRILDIASYEHIGGAAISVVGYFETFLAILIPIIVLKERLSWEMVVGGIIILFGVYVKKYHKYGKHNRHFHLRMH